MDDPHAVVAAYADLFLQAGGTLKRMAATGVRRDGQRWTVQGAQDSESLSADRVVVALGPWSRRC